MLNLLLCRCVEEFSAGASLRRLGNITGGSRGIDAFGGLLAVGTFGVYSGASDSRVLLYDIVTGELLHSIGGGGGPGTRVMGASGVRCVCMCLVV